MNITYNNTADLLYIRLDEKKQDVVNQRVSEDVVLDIGENDKILGIEIINASKHLDLKEVLPVNFKLAV